MEKISNGGLSENTGFLSGSQLSSPGTLLNIAVSILQAYGGSLWVASPNYCYIMSDGTGIPTDGSEIGYVRDLCGNARPLTQPTTSFKPKLKRVPKRLGPELVATGDFASSAGWVVGSGWAISGGAAQATAGNAWAALAQTAEYLQAGREYHVSADVTRASGTLYAQLATSGSAVTAFFATSSGKFSGVVAMPAGANPLVTLLNDATGGFVGSVDNVSVREVLEWGWAWVFDGADDYLGAAAKTGESGYLAVAFAESGVRWQALLGSGGLVIGRISTTTTDFFCGEIFAAAYCPGTLSDAERLIVERAMAIFGGIVTQ